MYPRSCVLVPTAGNFSITEDVFHRSIDGEYIGSSINTFREIKPLATSLKIRFRDIFDFGGESPVSRAGTVSRSDIFLPGEIWVIGALVDWMRTTEAPGFGAVRLFIELPGGSFSFPVLSLNRRGGVGEGKHGQCFWKKVSWCDEIVPGKWTMRVSDVLAMPLRVG